MTVDPNRIADAFRTLGLSPDASVADAKKTFRERVKALHPDRTVPTEETLAKLSLAIAAMRQIESVQVFETEIHVSPEQARTGVTRLVSSGLRREFVRVPPGTPDGSVLAAIGDAAARITIRHYEQAKNWTDDPPKTDPVGRFVADFAAPSPAARFARWARTPRSAA